MGFGEIYSIRHEIHSVKQTSYRARKQLVAPYNIHATIAPVGTSYQADPQPSIGEDLNVSSSPAT